MGAQHDGRSGRHHCDVVDEDHADCSEVVDHELVVHDLVEAVDGWLEDPRHPVECLYCLLHAGTEAPWGLEHDLVNLHAIQPNGGPKSYAAERHRVITRYSVNQRF